ncbi:MAG: RNA polymerase sigma factor [Cyclobacteriaceae bacterium]
MLYRHFYGYAMSVCMPYCQSESEAQEVANDGFMKTFRKIDQYNSAMPFKGWIRKLMINTALDFYRKEKKHYFQEDISELEVEEEKVETILDQLAAEEIMELVQQLSPGYRIVFILYVVEGLKHHEIAKQLDITEGTSKSNLAKAKAKLKAALLHHQSSRA